MLEIVMVILAFVSGIGFGVWCYKIGRKHGNVIGRAELAKEIAEMLEADCRKAYEEGYLRGHSEGVHEEKLRL